MNRWHSVYESVQFSVKILFLGLVFSTIGSLLTNQNLVYQFSLTNTYVTLVAQISIFIGSYIITLFPLILLVVLLSAKTEDRSQQIIGVINYFVFQIVIMFVYPLISDISVSSSALFSFMSVNLESSGLANITSSPFLLGTLASVLIYYITRSVADRTKRFGGYGVLGFLDHQIWSAIISLLLTVAAATLFAYGWPYVLNALYSAFDMINNDVKNPMNIFIYGLLDRFLSLIGMGDIIHREFWFGALGGSWMDDFGTVYQGDITIWMAQIDHNILFESGKFTAAYYISNLFAVPGYLLAVYRTFSGKFERRKYTILIILAFIIVAISGNSIAIDLFMILSAPLLYAVHLMLYAVISAILSGLSIYVGFSTFSTFSTASPGNIIDFIYYYSNQLLNNRIMLMIYIGIITFAVYFLITTYYYNNVALDILHTGVAKVRVEKMIEAFGGTENIRTIQSTPTKVIVNLEDRNKFNFSLAHEVGVVRIIESRVGYSLHFGSGSYMLVRLIKKKIREGRHQKPGQEIANEE